MFGKHPIRGRNFYNIKPTMIPITEYQYNPRAKIHLGKCMNIYRNILLEMEHNHDVMLVILIINRL